VTEDVDLAMCERCRPPEGVDDVLGPDAGGAIDAIASTSAPTATAPRRMKQ
jgi:hypothetical protein